MVKNYNSKVGSVGDRLLGTEQASDKLDTSFTNSEKGTINLLRVI